MRAGTELRLFRAVVGVVLLIPVTVSVVGAFGGLEAFARLLGADAHVIAAPSLRNHLRALSWMYLGYVPVIVWSLRSLEERRWAFRLLAGVATVGGLIRLVSIVADGSPGPVAIVLMWLELLLLPGLILWHARLIGRLTHATPSGRPDVGS